jgi:hypothetical protein
VNPRVFKCIKQHFASHTPYPQLSSEVISKLTKASAKTTTVIALNKVPSPCLVADTLQKISSHMLDKKQPEAQKSGSCHANATPESSKSPKDVEAAPGVVRSPSLECQLNISDNNLPMSCLPRIIEQLQSFPFKIAGFDASGNHKLGNNGVRDLLECNMSNAIKQIELRNTGLECPCTIVVASLAKCVHLTSLDLSDNPSLNATGVLHFLQQLPNTNLSTLHLRNCSLGNDAGGLASSFRRFKGLFRVDFSNNKGFSPDDLISLLNQLPSRLEYLRLGSLDLTSDHVSAIIDGRVLTRFKSLQEINLACNENLGPNGILSLLAPLCDPFDTSVRCLDISSSHRAIQNYDVGSFDEVLAFCFQKFPKLESLKVSHVGALANVPPSIVLSSHLTKLDLLNCSNLSSLPDEIFGMSQLKELDIHCCKSLEFPPFSEHWNSQIKSVDGTMTYSKDNRALLLEVKTFLKKAHKAEPLKRVKVLFLVRYPGPRARFIV